MSNSRTILPAPKLLNLISVHATENAITLAARTSSRVALCPLRMRKAVRQGSFPVHEDADRPALAGDPHHQRLTTLRLDRKASKERTRKQSQELFESIHALSKKNMKNSQIAWTLGIHRHTVEKYLAFKTPPQRRHFTKKVSALAPYEAYILKRWQQGCRNATRIWQEISEQGYPGAYQNVVRITRYLKEQERLAKPIPDRLPGTSASHATGILVKRSENRSEEEIRTLQGLKAVHRVTERCCSLFEEFAGMLRDKEQRSKEQARSRLKEWAERAKASGTAESKAFAVKLLQDTEAVVAAVILPYSQGQTSRAAQREYLASIHQILGRTAKAGQCQKGGVEC